MLSPLWRPLAGLMSWSSVLTAPGRVAGTSAQQSVVMGRSAAQAVVDYLAGNEVEKEIVLDTLLVTKDNIDELYDTLIEVALTEE